MARIKIRPWRDQVEFLDVRDNFFLADSIENVAARIRACERVEIWRRRARLPHAIESTLMLVQAQVQRHVLEASRTEAAYNTKASLATALSRFVTGYCDINQATVVKRSMFEVAAELGMAEEWVELRHQFTHGGAMPSIVALDSAVAGALAWLWDKFWSAFDEAHTVSGGTMSGTTELIAGEPQDDVKPLIKPILKAYVVRRQSVTERKATATAATEDALRSIESMVELDADLVIEGVISLLVERRMIIPSDHKPNASLIGAFEAWDPLLVALSLVYTTFLSRLIVSMLNLVLSQPSSTDVKSAASRQAYVEWLAHILTSRAWSRRHDQSQDGLRRVREQVAEMCLLQPSTQSTRLLEELENFDESCLPFRSSTATPYKRLEARPQDSVDSMLEAHDFRVGEMSSMNIINQQSAFDPLDYSGWRRWPGVWTPIPIGLAESGD